MSALNAPRTAREVAVPAAVITVTTATVAFLVWLYLTRSAAVVLAACGMLATAGLAWGLTAAALRMMRADDRAWGSDDPAEHLQPLRTPSPAERNLTIDLRARRMLLRPWGLSERHARALAVKVAKRARRMRAITHGPAVRPGPAPEAAPAAPDTPQAQDTPREPLAASLRAALAGTWARARSLRLPRLPQRKPPAPRPHSHRKPRSSAARTCAVTPPLIPYSDPEEVGRIVEARQRAVAAHEDTAVLPAPPPLPKAQNDPGCIFPDWQPEDSGIMRALRGEPV